jgi:hypothetical protein
VHDDRFDLFCVVGLGNHARTKLIPAIQANGQRLVGVVSSHERYPGIDAEIFRDLEQAIGALPSGVAFVVATPPAIHFEQASLILDGNFDLFLEKPAFVVRAEAAVIADRSARGMRLVIEGLMYLYTGLYREFKKFWSEAGHLAERIEIDFLIDQLPNGTFRSRRGLASSPLFDIGCYPMTLLAEIGLEVRGLKLTSLENAGDPNKTRISMACWAGDKRIEINIGMSDTYKNSVNVNLVDGRAVEFSPFFFGRAGQRAITTSKEGHVSKRYIDESDAFRTMLAMPRAVWRSTQPERLRQMIDVTGQLEHLAAFLK